MVDASKLNLFTPAALDKIPVSDTYQHTLDAATDIGGGFYSPKTEEVTIKNPYGQKAFLTLAWSIDNVNFYPQKPTYYNPGVAPYEEVGASVGGAVDDNFIYFYLTHYLGASTTFYIRWALDTIS